MSIENSPVFGIDNEKVKKGKREKCFAVQFVYGNGLVCGIRTFVPFFLVVSLSSDFVLVTAAVTVTKRISR